MNKGNCSSLVFIKFGKGRVCMCLCVFCGKVGWESGKGGKVGGRGVGDLCMYVFIRVIM